MKRSKEENYMKSEKKNCLKVIPDQGYEGYETALEISNFIPIKVR